MATTMRMDPEKLRTLARLLLQTAQQQQRENKVRAQDLPKRYFEDATGFPTEEIARGFKELKLIFLNDGGTIVFDPKALKKVIDAKP